MLIFILFNFICYFVKLQTYKMRSTWITTNVFLLEHALNYIHTVFSLSNNTTSTFILMYFIFYSNFTAFAYIELFIIPYK